MFRASLPALLLAVTAGPALAVTDLPPCPPVFTLTPLRVNVPPTGARPHAQENPLRDLRSRALNIHHAPKLQATRAPIRSASLAGMRDGRRLGFSAASAIVSPPFVSPSFVSPPFVSPPFVSPPFVSPSFVSPPFVSPSFVSPSFVSPSFAAPMYQGGTRQISLEVHGQPARLLPDHGRVTPQLTRPWQVTCTLTSTLLTRRQVNAVLSNQGVTLTQRRALPERR